jgi:alpha-glucoside transport system substrate-binding protein
MNKRWLKLAAVPVALSLVAAACGSDDDSGSDGDTGTETTDGGGDAGGDADFGGATVTLTGPERDDPSIAAINDTLNAWGETVNLTIEYTGDADWEANINTQVEGGNPPDISFFPQPGKLADFARSGYIVPLTDEVNATVDEFWADGYQLYGNVDDVQYGIPAKTDLKSLVWYQPAAFEEAGYEVPTTFDEFTALIEEMAAAGGPKPLCVGIESGQATGWPFTDWTEEMVLRQAGADVYDQWVNHEIPFDDPQIVTAMQTVADLWTEENVFAAGGSIAATAFSDNGQPLVDGQCYMHRQANFFAGLFPEGTTFADPEDPTAVDVFYFPDINGDRPALTAGIFAAAFNDDPATMAVMNYIATADYAETRQRNQTEAVGGGLSGYLSAAQGQDPSVYQPLEQSFLEILEAAEIARFDGSDLMPADVGAGTFWSEGTSLVNGDTTAADAAAAIEASWPS